MSSFRSSSEFVARKSLRFAGLHSRSVKTLKIDSKFHEAMQPNRRALKKHCTIAINCEITCRMKKPPHSALYVAVSDR
jgi:hypothetical protein